MTEGAKQAADTLRKMANFKQFLAFPQDTGRIINACADMIESLSAQLEQVTMERDAAVERLRGKCAECINEYPGITHLKGTICENCVFNEDFYAQAEDNWQWRGVEVSE